MAFNRFTFEHRRVGETEGSPVVETWFTARGAGNAARRSVAKSAELGQPAEYRVCQLVPKDGGAALNPITDWRTT